MSAYILSIVLHLCIFVGDLHLLHVCLLSMVSHPCLPVGDIHVLHPLINSFPFYANIFPSSRQWHLRYTLNFTMPSPSHISKHSYRRYIVIGTAYNNGSSLNTITPRIQSSLHHKSYHQCIKRYITHTNIHHILFPWCYTHASIVEVDSCITGYSANTNPVYTHTYTTLSVDHGRREL